MTVYPRIVEATFGETGERSRMVQFQENGDLWYHPGGTVQLAECSDITPLVTMEGGALPKVWREEHNDSITDGDDTHKTWVKTARDAQKLADKHHQLGWFYSAVARFLEAERLQELIEEANAQLAVEASRSGLKIPNMEIVRDAVRAGARLTLPKDGE